MESEGVTRDTVSRSVKQCMHLSKLGRILLIHCSKEVTLPGGNVREGGEGGREGKIEGVK